MAESGSDGDTGRDLTVSLSRFSVRHRGGWARSALTCAFLAVLAAGATWMALRAMSDLDRTEQVTVTFDEVGRDGSCWARYTVAGRPFVVAQPCPDPGVRSATRWYDSEQPDELGQDSPLTTAVVGGGLGVLGLLLAVIAAMALRGTVSEWRERPRAEHGPSGDQRARSMRRGRSYGRNGGRRGAIVGTAARVAVACVIVVGVGLVAVAALLAGDALLREQVSGELSTADGCLLTYRVDGRSYVSHDQDNCGAGAGGRAVDVAFGDGGHADGYVVASRRADLGNATLTAAAGAVLLLATWVAARLTGPPGPGDPAGPAEPADA